MVQKRDLIKKASKGFTIDYYEGGNGLLQSNFFKDVFAVMPNFDRKQALDIIRRDEMVLASITTLVDKSLEYGWRCSKLKQEELKKLRFSKLLRKILYNSYLYENVFIEIVKANNKVKELHVLETTTTEPLVTQNGETKGYQQLIPGYNEAITWNDDEVTHIALTEITSSTWGEISIETIYTLVLIKIYIKAYLGWLFGTNQLRGFYNIKDAQEDQVKRFIGNLKKTEADIGKPVIAEGEILYQILRKYDEGDQLINTLNYCNENIMSLLQTPPVLMGKPGESNRSSSDAQDSSLYTRIRAVQNVLEESFNYDLFPKTGLDITDFEFNPISKSSMEKVLQNVERMKINNFKEEVIEEYLRSEGFFRKFNIFKTPEEIAKEAEILTPKIEPTTTKSEDMYESRTRKADGEGNKRIGTGENSTTKKEQLVSKAYDFDPDLQYVEED